MPAASAIPLTGATVYVPVGPERIADTRLGTGFIRLDSRTIRVTVGGRATIPITAMAAVVTLTVVNARADGFLTAFAGGADRPGTSNLNFDRAATVANTAVVRLGTGSAIEIYDSVPGDDIIVDVSGAFTPVSGPTAAGRYVAVAATRVLDTRTTRSDGDPFLAGETRRLSFEPSVVPPDASAVVVNLTYVDTAGPGYFTVWPGGMRPNVSNGNLDRGGEIRACLAVVPLAVVESRASISIFSSAGAHVIADVAGYFTGPSSPVAADGLFVPQAPRRVLDTRRTLNPLAERTMTRVAVDAAIAAWANVTALGSRSPGYVTARPAFAALPATSNVNTAADGRPVANAVLIDLSTEGAQLFSSVAGHVVVDLYGWFVGAPAAARCRRVVLAHGGAYSGGSPADLARWAVEFEMAGWDVVNADYRVAGEYSGQTWGSWYPRTSVYQPIPAEMEEAHETAVSDLAVQLRDTSGRGCVTHALGYSAGGSALADAVHSVDGIATVHLAASAILDVHSVGGPPMHLWHSSNDPIITAQAAAESCPLWIDAGSSCVHHDLGDRYAPHIVVEMDEATTWLMLHG